MSVTTPILGVRDLVMDYPLERGVHRALHGIGFEVPAGEFFTLLGPSGCGKTTTLRSVAGLETPTGGQISIAGNPVFEGGRGLVVPSNRRDISMVFQSYAIWPHMTVGQNVAFPLQAMRRAGGGMWDEVARALNMVGLGGYLDRPATQLSGGQQQRVALARAIVKNAALLLLDEPLSNLDAKLREQMRQELRGLQQQLGTTTLYVTHDQEEALSLSDRIAVMKDGEIVEIGTPQDLYLRPRSGFTARFIGNAEVYDCAPEGRAQQGGTMVRTPLGLLRAEVNADRGAHARHVAIRAEHVRLIPRGERDGAERPSANLFEGIVEEARFSGRLIEYRVAVGGAQMTAQTLSTEAFEAGDHVAVHVPPERCVLLED
jgi:iron(III) transport system ATP-binding protein